MKTIYLIGCTKLKNNYKCLAEELYGKSNLFKLSLNYARTKVEDNDIFILSALYHLIPLNKEVSPYNETLSKMNKEKRNEWGLIIVQELERAFDINNTRFVFLTGKNYYEPLIPYLKHYEIPIPNNYGIGNRLKWLKENTHEGNTY